MLTMTRPSTPLGPVMLNTRVAEGVAVGVAEGMADADAEAEVAVFAVVVARLGAVWDALLAVRLLLVDDVQPAIANDATITSTMTANNFFIIYIALDEKINQKCEMAA